MHEGHRERLRRKGTDYGIGCLEDHECLELILGYAIPRKNTNELAHELLKKAGSLRGVFDMDVTQLKQVKGIGDSSAFMLKLIDHVMRRPRTGLKKRVLLNKASAVRSYADVLFATSDHEEMHVLYLDKKMMLTERIKVSEGSEWQAGVSVRDILIPGLLSGAAGFIIIHNHPKGLPSPSQADIGFTIRTEAASKAVGLTMIEHVVYAEGEIYPIMQTTKIRSLDAIEYDEGRNDIC